MNVSFGPRAGAGLGANGAFGAPGPLAAFDATGGIGSGRSPGAVGIEPDFRISGRGIGFVASDGGGSAAFISTVGSESGPGRLCGPPGAFDIVSPPLPFRPFGPIA
jgi:hypothetical protein